MKAFAEDYLGAPDCSSSSPNFSKNLDECRWVPFCVEVPAPANEEVDGTRNRPSPNISIPIHHPINWRPLFRRPQNSGVPC
jgi:hypothetical protein